MNFHHTYITTTPSQSLTNLFEVLTINSEMKASTEAVITPFETLPTLWGPMTPPMTLPNPSLLCNCDTIWSAHHLHLAPWYHNFRGCGTASEVSQMRGYSSSAGLQWLSFSASWLLSLLISFFLSFFHSFSLYICFNILKSNLNSQVR